MRETALDRTEQFIGRTGLDRLRGQSVAIVGAGGLGTHVTQQLAFLRVGKMSLIDPGVLKESSRNRYVGSRFDDTVGTPKVDLAERLALGIEPAMEVRRIQESFVSHEGYAAIVSADCVFGCVDKDGTRLVLNELCAAYARPYVDVATEIPPDNVMDFGGRVCTALDGKACLYCLDVLDIEEAHRQLRGPVFELDHQRMYGAPAALLPGGGPAVVSLNGILASLAVTEFLVWSAGLRDPKQLLTYRGARGIVTDRSESTHADCYYCRSVFGKREAANVERYISSGIGEWLL